MEDQLNNRKNLDNIKNWLHRIYKYGRLYVYTFFFLVTNTDFVLYLESYFEFVFQTSNIFVTIFIKN